MSKFTVYIGTDLSETGVVYRLFVDGGIGVNLVGDRHIRGAEFPASFKLEGWTIDCSSDFLDVMKAHEDMQAYFDEHFNGGLERRPKPAKVMADKKSSLRIAKRR